MFYQTSKGYQGFTLTELLIGLAILGAVSVYAIPKILYSQQNAKNKAMTTEVAGMIAGAYEQAQLAGITSSSTTPGVLTPYLNYVSIDTSSTINAEPTISTYTCSVSKPCLKLHNGGMLYLDNTLSFGGTTSLNVIHITFDPNPTNVTTSTADGPLKAVEFGLYYNGFITTRGKLFVGSVDSGGTAPINAFLDPSWFNWQQ